LRSLNLVGGGFDLDFELVDKILLAGYTIHEVALDYTPRTYAQGKKIKAWDGLRGEIRFDRDWNNLQTELHAPGLRLTADKTDLLRFDELRLTSNLKQGVAGLYLGHSELIVGKLVVRHPAQPGPLELRNLRADSQTRAGGPETIDVRIRYRLQEIHFNGTRLGPGELLLEFRRLDAAALQAYEKKLRKLAREGKPPEQISMIVLGESLKLLGVLARRSPELEVMRVSLQSDRGELTGRAKLAIDGARANIADNPLLLLTALHGNADVRVPAGYIRPLLEPIIRQDIESLGRARRIGREDMKAMSPEQLGTIITNALPHYLSRHPLTRHLVSDGENYRLQATLRRGELLINGQPWSGGTPLPVSVPTP